ncbi:MAG: hypothetical protein QNI89_16395 [Desulfobacterales bacterium]|nr:hypothetical protein [Desulfobacterales bacterium]
MLLAGILLMAAMGLGCENRTEPAAQAPHRAGEQSVTRDGLLTGYRKQVVQPVGPETVNPLARAMALVGYDPAGPQPPHFSQAGYNLIGNLPIVDLIQETPLAMPAWAEARSRGFQQMARQGFGPLLAGMMGTLDHESEAVSNTPPRNPVPPAICSAVLKARHCGLAPTSPPTSRPALPPPDCALNLTPC